MNERATKFTTNTVVIKTHNVELFGANGASATRMMKTLVKCAKKSDNLAGVREGSLLDS